MRVNTLEHTISYTDNDTNANQTKTQSINKQFLAYSFNLINVYKLVTIFNGMT